MSIILDLEPEIERGLLARAEAKGVSLADYAHEILAREVGGSALDAPGESPLAENLFELVSPVRGLLSDEEIDRYFSRNPSTGRPIDLA